jgi:ubiquinone/menaquinone biosynthesis methyltransferase
LSIHQRNENDWVVADPQAHDRQVRGMFSRISGVYDFMNHLLSFNRDKAWRREVVRRLDADTGTLLDLCAGTGDLGLEALDAGKAQTVIAADFCTDMLLAGAEKGIATLVPAATADAQQLPFADNAADASVVGFGVRNLADVRQGVEEIKRVLKPGSLYMVLDFYRSDAGAEGEARGVPGPVRWYLNTVVPLFGRIFGGSHSAYSYLAVSMGRFLTPGEYARMLEDAGFRDVFIKRLTFGIAHIVGGRAP